MADGLFVLLALSAVMAIASFLAGALPLSFSLSQSQLRLISSIGMGVLVGTSLIVIIPEGIETLYSASTVTHTRSKRAHYTYDHEVRWAHLDAQKPVEPEQPGQSIWPKISISEELEAIDSFPVPVPIDCNDFTTCQPIQKRSPADASSLPEDQMNHKAADEDLSKPGLGPSEPKTPHASSTAHIWVGISLTLGFVLMYLIDALPRHASSSRLEPEPYHISLDNLSQGLQRPETPSSEAESQGFLRSRSRHKHPRSNATTTGLVIHAAADGIALGASSSTANPELGLIVFVAIMVHKAPAAFGLTSVLLKQGLSKRSARAHLLVFSLAAPAGALATWVIAQVAMGGSVGEENSTKWWTGVLLLFSAGTFLYVAMHAMQESGGSHEAEHSNGYADGPRQRRQGPALRETLGAVCGMLLPLLTQFGGHEH